MPSFLLSQSVKTQIFAQTIRCGKKHHRRKSGKSVETGKAFLCKAEMHIHNQPWLWKTPVDKPVENVENTWFSTAISHLCFRTHGCGKRCIPVCITSVTKRLQPCYVTGTRKFLPPEKPGNCSHLWKKCCQSPSPSLFRPKFFV